MKTTFFNSLLCASLLVFAVGCGKEKSKSKGQQYTNLYNQGLTANNQAVVQKLTNWFNSSQEGAGFLGAMTIKKTQYVYNNAQNCVEKKFLGIPYQYCSYSNSAPQGTEVSSSTATLYQDGIIINARGNAELNNLFNGSHGTLIGASDISQTASQLDFLSADGKVVSFVIDTNYHSGLNPVKKSTVALGVKTDIITTATRL